VLVTVEQTHTYIYDLQEDKIPARVPPKFCTDDEDEVVMLASREFSLL